MVSILKLAKFYKPNDAIIVVDVGAYTGIVYEKADLFNRYPNMVIHAIEPCPKNYRELEKTKAHHTYNFAIGDRNGHAELFVTDLKKTGSSEGNTFYEETIKKKGVDYYPVKTAVYTLDNFVSMAKIEEIDILTINCEGAEELIFSAPTTKFLDITNTISVDIHDNVDADCIASAIEPRGFSKLKSGKEDTCFYVKKGLL